MLPCLQRTTLRFLPRLSNLNLDKNKIGARGVAAFADAVNNALLPNLKQASVDYQPYATIGPKEEWIKAREALRAACTSKKIDLSGLSIRLTAEQVAQWH